MGPSFSLLGELFFVFFLDQSFPLAISLGQKCWPTVLEIKNTCSQWVGGSMHSKSFDFFSFKSWVEGVGEVFFHFSFVPSMFPLSAQWVPKFPMCYFPRVFQVAPCFSPIYFAQSPKWVLQLLSHMPWKLVSSFHLYRGAKGEELYTSK
jgi:hypothetical protein